MIEKEFEVCNLLGLHVRASSKLVEAAASFISEIKIITPKAQADLKRIMQVMGLGLKYKDKFKLVVTGEDAEIALKEIESLILSGFGEN